MLQISGLNERTGGKSGIKWKMQLTQSNSFHGEFKEKCETMIHIFKYRTGKTYEQIKLAKNRLFLLTRFNPLSPIVTNINFLLTHNVHTRSRD